MIVCNPVVDTENGMLNELNPVLGGEIKPPIWMPSTLTLIGCRLGGTQHERCAAWNEIV